MKSILVINSGSSSLKFSVFTNDQLQPIFNGTYEKINLENSFVKSSYNNEVTKEEFSKMSHKDCLKHLFSKLNELNIDISIAGHRVVHGGDFFKGACLLDAKNISKIESFTSLAPLHQPHNLAGIYGVREFNPNIPQIAVFDTQFHQTQPIENTMFALPRKFFNEGIKSYGFHGISYDFINDQIRKNNEELNKKGKIVVCHLGNGSSLCAIKDGESVGTTMGFTAIDGLIMGTRCGILDAGVVLHLITELKMEPKQVLNILYKESGLLGISELSSDMRELEQHKETNSQAKDAINLYVNRVCQQIAKLSQVMEGIDAIVFTGGIGENSKFIRESVINKLNWLGFFLDANKNNTISNSFSNINSLNSKLIYVVKTNEELKIAEYAKNFVN